jgi:high-affinity nickel permease
VIPLLLGVLAIALGFKHAYDADHLVAVANILGRAPSTRRAARLSVAWALGHMLTAGAITVALYFFGRTLLGEVAAHLDLLVGLMLVAIGAIGIAAELSVAHRHAHAHAGAEHEHAHTHFLAKLWPRALDERGEHRAMLGIGIVHGLASNDELLVLFATALSITSLGGILLGVAIFSLGVVVGMVAFAAALTWPMLRWGQARVRRAVNLGVGGLSLAYGGLLLAGVEGVNALALLGLR